MILSKSGIFYDSVEIPSLRTHNTIPPFSSGMIKGSKTSIDVIKIIGKKPNPCIYIGGATHGDELNGVCAVLKLAEEISPSQIDGSLILVPVQNPLGYEYRERLNPYDPIDPDWVPTDKHDGTYTQRVKHILGGFLKEADCVIDLHTAGRGGVNNTMIYVPPENGNGKGQESFELSGTFGGDRIIFGNREEAYDWPVRYTLPFIAVREGKTGIYAESGEGGATIPDSGSVEYFVNGVKNVMKKLGMIDGEIILQGERKRVDPANDKSISVNSDCKGIFLPKVRVGTKVKEGDVLGEVQGIIEGRLMVKAPLDGLIMWRNSYGSVEKGRRLYSISY